MIHSGHYNAIRQAKALCDTLVVGVNSDEEVIRVKGPTILSTKERSDIIRSCRWVDEVAEGTEYSVSEEVLDRYNCQFYAHGDDAVIDADGNDMCAILEGKGRFKMFKRTTGVSTTDIIGKLLSLTKENYAQTSQRKRSGSFSRPLKTSEYVEEVRKAEEETFNEQNPSSARGKEQVAAHIQNLKAQDPIQPKKDVTHSLGIA